jgi:hypothetical protein
LRDCKKTISLEEFIVAWSYLANRDYKLCYESLYEIGYEGSLENTFDVTSPKLSLNDMLKIQDRSVIYVGILDSGGEESSYLSKFFPHPTIE